MAGNPGVYVAPARTLTRGSTTSRIWTMRVASPGSTRSTVRLRIRGSSSASARTRSGSMVSRPAFHPPGAPKATESTGNVPSVSFIVRRPPTAWNSVGPFTAVWRTSRPRSTSRRGVGDRAPASAPELDRRLRRRLVERGLEVLQTAVSGPTLFHPVGGLTMEFVLGTFPVDAVGVGAAAGWQAGRLTVDPARVREAVLDDPRIRSVAVDLVEPGEATRIVQMRDVVEPPVKVRGPRARIPRNRRASDRHGRRRGDAPLRRVRRHGVLGGAAAHPARRERGHRQPGRHVRAGRGDRLQHPAVPRPHDRDHARAGSPSSGTKPFGRPPPGGRRPRRPPRHPRAARGAALRARPGARDCRGSSTSTR